MIRLTTPLIALAPQTAEDGPFTTSTRSRSSTPTEIMSQATNPKKSWYTDRPSTSTSCDVESVPAVPRLWTLMSRFDIWVTLTPGAWRIRSPSESDA